MEFLHPGSRRKCHYFHKTCMNPGIDTSLCADSGFGVILAHDNLSLTYFCGAPTSYFPVLSRTIN